VIAVFPDGLSRLNSASILGISEIPADALPGWSGDGERYLFRDTTA